MLHVVRHLQTWVICRHILNDKSALTPNAVMCYSPPQIKRALSLLCLQKKATWAGLPDSHAMASLVVSSQWTVPVQPTSHQSQAYLIKSFSLLKVVDVEGFSNLIEPLLFMEKWSISRTTTFETSRCFVRGKFFQHRDNPNGSCEFLKHPTHSKTVR